MVKFFYLCGIELWRVSATYWPVCFRSLLYIQERVFRLYTIVATNAKREKPVANLFVIIAINPIVMKAMNTSLPRVMTKVAGFRFIKSIWQVTLLKSYWVRSPYRCFISTHPSCCLFFLMKLRRFLRTPIHPLRGAYTVLWLSMLLFWFRRLLFSTNAVRMWRSVASSEQWLALFCFFPFLPSR